MKKRSGKVRFFLQVNMKNINLDERLSAVADLVPEGAVLLDVGTDHGYLPAKLILNEKIQFAGAADINRDPLSKAVATARELGIESKMVFYLSDGLRDIPDMEKYTSISVCGMGGELIARILSDSPRTKEKDVSLILQPMSSVEELSLWLSENGFAIEDERVTYAAGKVYRVMLVKYTGERYTLTAAEHLLGKINIERGSTVPEFEILLLKNIAKYRRIINGKKLGGADSYAEEDLLELMCRIAEKEGISYDPE